MALSWECHAYFSLGDLCTKISKGAIISVPSVCSNSILSIFTIKILISDAATIAQWKDALNDAWADLGELIDTRTQMLEASKELHKYFHDCKDVLGRILEKENSMSEELGRDSGSVSALLRKHQNFLQDLQGKTFFEKFRQIAVGQISGKNLF